jgi:hypothetical protein
MRHNNGKTNGVKLDGINGWPTLLGPGAESISHIHGHIDRENGRVEHIVDVRPHRGWFQRRDKAPRVRRERGDGARLIDFALTLLALLGCGLIVVSYAAQYRYVLIERGQVTASAIEAAALDVGMIIFSLLALGLARKGKPAKAERALVVACAAGSAIMNYAAADVSSPRSVLAFCMPPVFLAVVVDRCVRSLQRHVLGMEHERSPFAPLVKLGQVLGIGALYVLRLILDPIETPKGLRRVVLNATPLPEAPPVVLRDITVIQPKAISVAHKAIEKGKAGPRGPRGSSKSAALIKAVIDKYGPLAQFPLNRVSPACKELAPTVGMDAGWARTVLRKAVISAYAENHAVPPQGDDEGQEEAK